MDRIQAMSTLLAVVRAGSLSAASRELRTPISTVSRHISDLEGHLRTRLLHRTTHRVTLTDAGEAYAAACRHILEQVNEAERAAAGEYRAPQGELTVTASLTLGRLHIAPIAADFIAAYPDIVLHLRLIDRVLDLHQEHVDIGVRIGLLPESSLIARRVGAVRQIIAASPDYLARRGTPEAPADLAGHDCLDFAGFRRIQAWPSPAEGEAAPIRPRLSMDAAEPLVDAAVAGVGIVSLFSYHVAAAVKTGRLVPLLRDFTPPPLPVHLVYLGGGPLPLKVRAFLDFAVPRLKASLDGDAL